MIGKVVSGFGPSHLLRIDLCNLGQFNSERLGLLVSGREGELEIVLDYE